MFTLLVPWFNVITNWLFVAPGDLAPTANAPCVASAPSPSCASGARVIEFHVPATFQLPERRWLPPEARGKLIEFPTRGVRKSA